MFVQLPKIKVMDKKLTPKITYVTYIVTTPEKFMGGDRSGGRNSGGDIFSGGVWSRAKRSARRSFCGCRMAGRIRLFDIFTFSQLRKRGKRRFREKGRR